MFEGMRFKIDLPPVWLSWFSLIAFYLERLMPIWRFDAGLLGPGVIALGLGLIGWSAWFFWRKRTPIEPGVTPKVLIVQGPYRLTRNPIYVGLVVILLGIALWRGALSAMIPVILFPILLTYRFVRPEETVLRDTFGAEAESYLQRTRRWLV